MQQLSLQVAHSLVLLEDPNLPAHTLQWLAWPIDGLALLVGEPDLPCVNDFCSDPLLLTGVGPSDLNFASKLVLKGKDVSDLMSLCAESADRTEKSTDLKEPAINATTSLEIRLPRRPDKN
jgi:hypothetical protein